MVHRDHAYDKVHDQDDDEGSAAGYSIPFGLKETGREVALAE